MAAFSGLPETRWELGGRLMTLLQPLSYTDKNGREWKVPTGAELNGATIPRALWSIVGSPYVGLYRRASIVHDFYVGEGGNDDVSYRERRKADKMFFRACRTDGVKRKAAIVLYLGVSVGSWASRKNMKGFNLPESLMEEEMDEQEIKKIDKEIQEKYHEIVAMMEVKEKSKSDSFEMQTMNEETMIGKVEEMVDFACNN